MGINLPAAGAPSNTTPVQPNEHENEHQHEHDCNCQQDHEGTSADGDISFEDESGSEHSEVRSFPPFKIA